MAIDNARREAVEKVVGVDLLSETMVINYNVSSDVVRTIPHGKVIGVDYQTGDVKWQFATEASKQNYQTIYDETGEFKKDFVLYGKDWKISEKMIHALGSVLSSPAVDNGVIYFGSSDGHMYAVKLP